MTAAGLRSLLRHHRQTTGIKLAHPHRLRHTFAPRMVRAGMSLPALMRLMGNADIQTTLQHVRITPQDVYLEYARAVAQHIRLSRRLRYESRARPPRQHPLAAAQQNICSRTCGSAIDLESEPCVQLNLTRRAYGGEYSTDVLCET